MVVPAARNLHWRYQVLHSAFMVCKQKVAPGESLTQNLHELVEATRRIWQRIASNIVVINKQKKPMNGNLGMLFSADDITSAEKNILRSYLNTTANISGCQAIRKKKWTLLFWLSCGARGSYICYCVPESTAFVNDSKAVEKPCTRRGVATT